MGYLVPMVAAGLAVCVSAIVSYFMKLLKDLAALDKLPHPPVANTLTGVALTNVDFHRTLTGFAAKYGGIYSIRFYHQKVVIVSDPELVHQLVARTSKLDKSTPSYFPLDMLTFGRPSLLSHSTHSNVWKHVRKNVAPAFAMRNMKNGLPHVVSIVGQLVEALKELGPDAVVDMDAAAQRESLDVIGAVGFGKSFGATRCLSGDGAESALSIIQKAMIEGQKYLSNPLRQYLWFLPDVRRGMADLRAFHKIVEGLLADLRARGPPADDDTSIAAHLMRIRDPATGKPLPDEQLLPEIAIFFVAGMETTGHTIAWTLYLISQHPQAEAKIVAELDAAGLLVTAERPHPRAFAFEDLSALPYLSACIKESMRILPVAASGTSREAPVAMQLGGYHIPAHTQLWVPLHTLLNSPHNWDRPDAFLPERWADPDAEYATVAVADSSAAGNGANGKPGPTSNASHDGHPTAARARTTGSSTGEEDADGGGKRPKRFLPFSGGMRDCAGRNLATMSYTTAIALLLASFHFRLADEMGGAEGVRATERVSITLSMCDGMKMHAIPRPC